jgi:hypothetical protein
MKNSSRTSVKGAFAYENWKLALAKSPARSVLEFPLFTDAHIIGKAPESNSPYLLLNVVPIVDAHVLAPAIVLRMEYYIEPDISVIRKTDVDRFHGGGINDEIAALISLCLGVRLKSGGFTRYFDPEKDPRGQPVAWKIQENPILLKTTRRTILPQALGDHDLSGASLLENFHQLSPDASVALVRAARLYQDALWIIESEPQLSWVMPVSAIEAAANYWRPSKEPPLERMRLFDPSLKNLLLEAGGNELAMRVADKIKDVLGSTRKFVDFITEFLPEPPKERPVEYYQHSWEKDQISRTMGKIYQWRSFALHRGIPFPISMCEAPGRDGAYFEEIPSGLAVRAKGGAWTNKDAPMLLHIFEYIVRNSLLKWWQSMVTQLAPDG